MAGSQPTIPAGLSGKLQTFLNEAQYAAVLDAYTMPRRTALRVNTIQSTPHDISTALKRHGLRYDTVPWSDDVFVLEPAKARTLTGLPEYQRGEFYVQNPSSMIPALVLAPQPDEQILDITAAPGSKTTQMAALMQNSGTILANDTSTIRLEKLKANLRIQGVSNVRTVRSAAQALWHRFPEQFDRVLVDVPCSMEGRIQLHLPKTYERWSQKKVDILSKIQRWILRSAVSCTKPGGTIVYSTCTLSPEENEGVVDWILAKERGSIRIDPVTISGMQFSEPVRSYRGRAYADQVQATARILPSDVYEGFFIAHITKLRSTV